MNALPRILCFDVEANGLHGPAFAVGAVVIDARDARELDSLLARAPTPEPVDPWVAAHVLPALAGVPVTAADGFELRAAFWQWYEAQCELGPLVLVADCGWPVEARFLAACVDDDPARADVAPFPLHDVATLLLLAAGDARQDRAAWAAAPGMLAPLVGAAHDPRHDARVSARCAWRALRQLAPRPWLWGY